MDDGDEHNDSVSDGEGRTANVGSPSATPNPYGHVNSRGSEHDRNGNGSVASPLLGPSLQRRQSQGRGVNGGGGSHTSEKRRTDDEETERNGGESRDEEKLDATFERGSGSSTPRVVIEIDEEMEVPAEELGGSHLNASSDDYLSARKGE